MKPKKAFQDYFPGNRCFGCGPANPHPDSYHLKSYWLDKSRRGTICKFTPKFYHSAATPDAMHGGVVASLLDCPSIWAAISARYKLENRRFGSRAGIWYVTARLEVDYRKPTPIDRELTILSTILETREKKSIVESELWAGEERTALGLVVAVRVHFDEKTIVQLSHHPENKKEV